MCRRRSARRYCRIRPAEASVPSIGPCASRPWSAADHGWRRGRSCLDGQGAEPGEEAGVGAARHRVCRRRRRRRRSARRGDVARRQIPAWRWSVDAGPGVVHRQIAPPHPGRVGLAGGEAGLAVVEEQPQLAGSSCPGRHPHPGEQPAGGADRSARSRGRAWCRPRARSGDRSRRRSRTLAALGGRLEPAALSRTRSTKSAAVSAGGRAAAAPPGGGASRSRWRRSGPPAAVTVTWTSASRSCRAVADLVGEAVACRRSRQRGV